MSPSRVSKPPPNRADRANVYEDRDDISLAPDEALLAGSVFLGMDTVLGPV